jgi:hypothetical protein
MLPAKSHPYPMSGQVYKLSVPSADVHPQLFTARLSTGRQLID